MSTQGYATSGQAVTPKRETQISIKMHNLKAAIDYAEKAAHGLAERIAVVLGPETTLDNKAGNPRPPLTVQLAEDINALADQVERIANFIESVHGRVEL